MALAPAGNDMLDVMLVTRRSFVSALAVARVLSSAAGAKRILILGGTGFLGPAIVEAATARGHQLTLFNRGRTRPGLFPNIETLLGDRDPKVGEGLNSLRNRKWDVVIDDSGNIPRHVAASTKLLAANAGHYIYISSISAYADNSIEGQDENGKLATTDDPTVETITDRTFGPLKVLCEKAASEAFGERATIVRPGYIVGPDDPSGRFTYWPVRIDRGGEVLVPGAPSDPIQFIDVRDLGAWLVLVAEQTTTGTFNATGPADRLAWGDVVHACSTATKSAHSLTWVPAGWVRREARPGFPIWAPYEGSTRGFHRWSNARAIRAGLKFRPFAQTVADTLSWYKSQPEGGRTKLAGPTPEKEAELLAKWKASQG
jgi:2'-hydroxyisoflavone reductase